MATIIEANPQAGWRKRLLPASYDGAEYHVEQQARNSGRRVVTHEYPKRDLPYAEDMGRHAIRYQITGYVIMTPRDPDAYTRLKEALIDRLENSEGGMLVDPYMPKGRMMAICERYSVTDMRERGGYSQFEMMFVELGSPGNSQVATDTGKAVRQKSDATSAGAAQSLNQSTPESTNPISPRVEAGPG